MENTMAPEPQVFEDLLYELFALPFSRTAEIKVVEQKIMAELQKHPANICGLISLMFACIMQGNRSKAKELSYKIWEIGGALPPFFELVYTENLLSLGLVDMATILLKPRFEHLRENIEDFYSVLAKFAVMTGNISLLKRLEAFPEASEGDELLFEFAALYEEANCQAQFKDIQKLVLEHSADYLCAYEYNLYDDRDFAELEIVLYVNFDDISCLKMQSNIENKIEAYWRSTGKERLYNLSVIVRNIKQHESWIEDEEEA